MVVFTCNHCGETLHKPKVEKHYQFTCRNYKSVTCVDCFKDFRDEEYVPHTKCITEDERYAAKGTYKNGIVKKGDVKQESWLEMIKSICETEKNLKPSLRNLLSTISEYTNVPRKKSKFMNFIRSSSGNRANMKEVEEVWDIIEKYKTKNKSNNQNDPKIAGDKKPEGENQQATNDNSKPEIQNKKRSIENDNTREESPKKKKKKSVKEGNHQNGSESTKTRHNLEPFKGTQELFNEENGNNKASEQLEKSKKNKEKVSDDAKLSELTEVSTESLKFNYKEKILEILSEKPSISFKKLQKKIIKAYVNATGQSDCEEKVTKKLSKKLKKIPNVGIEDDRVVLSQ